MLNGFYMRLCVYQKVCVLPFEKVCSKNGNGWKYFYV